MSKHGPAPVERISMSIAQIEQALCSFSNGARQRIIDELCKWQQVNDAIRCEKPVDNLDDVKRPCTLPASHIGACSSLPVDAIR